MFAGLDHVTKAVQALHANADYLDRLKTAAAEVAVSLVQPEEWPPGPLLERARAIVARKHQLADMSPGEREGYADDVRDLWLGVECERRVRVE